LAGLTFLLFTLDEIISLTQGILDMFEAINSSKVVHQFYVLCRNADFFARQAIAFAFTWIVFVFTGFFAGRLRLTMTTEMPNFLDRTFIFNVDGSVRQNLVQKLILNPPLVFTIVIIAFATSMLGRLLRGCIVVLLLSMIPLESV